MTINKNEIVTEVHQPDSLYRLLDVKEQLGNPCMLMIFTDSSTVLGADDKEKKAVRDFFAEAPFISAIAADGDPDAELSETADLSIMSFEAADYTERLFRDKTKKQIAEINGCFITARNSSAEKVLEAESRAFYRLMADRNGGGCNE